MIIEFVILHTTNINDFLINTIYIIILINLILTIFIGQYKISSITNKSIAINYCHQQLTHQKH